MKFSAVFNSIQKGMHKFQGSIKKEVEIPGVFKKNSCRIFSDKSLFSPEFLRV